MPNLKLPKLPDRTPVKLSIMVSPDLNCALRTYTELYREAYGTDESVQELIPYMLKGFLDSDRGFAKARKGKPLDDEATEPVSAPRSIRQRRRQTAEPSSATS